MVERFKMIELAYKTNKQEAKNWDWQKDDFR
jgi:hypothetical protein